jgi:hypothetical protein
MNRRDLNAQLFDPKPCELECRRAGVVYVTMPWGTPALVCETHRAEHAAKAKLWPAKDAIRAILRGAS